MGNIINPEWYIIKGKVVTSNFSEVIDVIYDPTAVNPYIWIIYIPVAYISPIIIIFGIIGNFLVLLHMSKRKVNINCNARFFYLFIGVSDLLNNLSYGVGIQILMDAMYIWTDKKLWLSTYPKSIEKLNIVNASYFGENIAEMNDSRNYSFFDGLDGVFWCKLLLSLWYFTSSCSTFGIVAFSIERFLAVYFPFWSMRVRSIKLSIILLIICIAPPTIVKIPLTIMVGSAIRDPTWSFLEYSCIEDPAHPLYVMAGLTLSVEVFVHVCLNAVLVIAIIFKIRISAILRKKSCASSGGANLASSQTASSSSELRTSITLLLLAGVNIVIFGSISFFYLIYVLSTPLLYTDSSTAFLAGTFTRISGCICNIPLSINFLIYLIVIPQFRRSVVNSCGKKGIFTSDRKVTSLH